MLTYIKESHRRRGTIHEEVLCAEHLAELPLECRTAHGRDKGGYRLEVREWTGEPVECSQCGVLASMGGNVATVSQR